MRPPAPFPAGALATLVAGLRARRWANLAVAWLRLLIGFALLPAGLKKVLGQPFTDPRNHGLFHDFLHAFLATGGFYRAVGALQLAAALLLMTQRFAALGAALALPMLTAIGAFCWSTAGVPTTTVVSLMWLGTLGLLLWDLDRWVGLLRPDGAAQPPAADVPPSPPLAPIDRGLWQRCGAVVAVLYLTVTALAGEIYRPRGLELDRPAFYLLVALPFVPLVTQLLDARRARRARRVRLARTQAL